MMTNVQQLKIAESYLGSGGSVFRRYCGLPGGAPYCDAYVTTIFGKAGNSSLFCNSTKQTYVPTTLSILTKELAMIPPYISMASDVIIFDWNDNEVPDHIGFVVEPISAVKVKTIEGNTTSRGIVAYRERPIDDIQAIFRPQFKATFDTSKALVIDGHFGYNSIAMLQIALKNQKCYDGAIDGILGQRTVKGLQKYLGVTQDASWGTRTSKALQKKLGVEQDGYFGPDSVKALQKWINANVKPQTTPKPTPNLEPTPVKKLAVDGDMGTATVKASQKLFGTVQDGVISGQLKANKKYYPNILAVSFGGGGSLMVERLQAWVGTSVDGIIGTATVKAWQKKIGVKVDGYFGAESVKAWQKYLNAHDTVVIPAPVMTVQDKMCAWARKICASGKYHYKVFGDNPATQKCPICNPGTGDGYNCIGYSFACWRHGGDLPCRCNCEVINDTMGNKMYYMSDAELQSFVKQRVKLNNIKVIRNKSGIPTSELRKGDIIMYYKGDWYAHMAMYVGDGKMTDSARGHSPQIQYGMAVNWWTKTNGWTVKIAIRYTGK